MKARGVIASRARSIIQPYEGNTTQLRKRPKNINKLHNRAMVVGAADTA
jgi:hypothetical protein